MKRTEIVKQVRGRLGISQEDLARALHVSFATVNRWENNQTSPSRLAWRQFVGYCQEMSAKGKLTCPEVFEA
jgi:ribosome-binding protein aMBF1 (putative translation factor)